MNIKIIALFSIIFFGLISCDTSTQKEFFDKMVHDEYHSKYDGLVIKKYIDKQNRGRPIIIIRNEIFGNNKKDFVFQSNGIFDFIQVGDSISKAKESLILRIKRTNMDTVIKLDFGKIKGSEKYASENQYLKMN
ncbi:hypothetical protein [Maribacter cobaltidurans]|nr:hypothetical protein [Maribacter cobaltidurans]